MADHLTTEPRTGEIYDVAVIGGGPGGLNAALVLGRSRRRTLVVDAGGGRNAAATAVHGLIGAEGISPTDLRKVAREQLDHYPDVRVHDGRVDAVTGELDRFELLVDGEEVAARRVVLATGITEDLPDVAGVRERWGRGVLGCPYCHAWEYRDQPLAVLGGDDADCDFAVQLSRWSSDVVLCTGGREDLARERRAALGRRGVRVRAERVERVEGPDGTVENVVFDTGERLACTAVFLHARTRQASELPQLLGCAVLDDDSVRVDEHGRTDVPGVYAVGDMARRAEAPSGFAFVATAAAAGFVTATAVDHDLFAS
ncbi:NAD(P)/FAD-dependent oxidoreductase [Umezawaea beigongshangensis]|uniref:NAD(P)/FAD-dependent oxidoreductase n=1 Tax=Umezawaea beigongshangensis TaxID=2780383 RepID=UPI0018F1CA9C|nr:NAD(P)/FAD-dependent oxidoreductase [Umezawaea beigongshangensis]